VDDFVGRSTAARGTARSTFPISARPRRRGEDTSLHLQRGLHGGAVLTAEGIERIFQAAVQTGGSSPGRWGMLNAPIAGFVYTLRGPSAEILEDAQAIESSGGRSFRQKAAGSGHLGFHKGSPKRSTKQGRMSSPVPSTPPAAEAAWVSRRPIACIRRPINGRRRIIWQTKKMSQQK